MHSYKIIALRISEFASTDVTSLIRFYFHFVNIISQAEARSWICIMFYALQK